METKIKKETGKEEEKMRMSWSEKAIDEYRKWLERGEEAKTWKDLKKKVGNAVHVRKGRKAKGRRVTWWDKECRILKTRMRRFERGVGKGIRDGVLEGKERTKGDMQEEK